VISDLSYLKNGLCIISFKNIFWTITLLTDITLAPPSNQVQLTVPGNFAIFTVTHTQLKSLIVFDFNNALISTHTM